MFSSKDQTRTCSPCRVKELLLNEITCEVEDYDCLHSTVFRTTYDLFMRSEENLSNQNCQLNQITKSLPNESQCEVASSKLALSTSESSHGKSDDKSKTGKGSKSRRCVLQDESNLAIKRSRCPSSSPKYYKEDHGFALEGKESPNKDKGLSERKSSATSTYVGSRGRRSHEAIYLKVSALHAFSIFSEHLLLHNITDFGQSNCRISRQ